MLFTVFTALLPLAYCKPFLETTSSGDWTFGNEVWNVTQRRSTRADELWYKDTELVGRSVGHYYSSSVADNNLTVTAAKVADEGEHDGVAYLDLYFESQAGRQHWVIFEGQHGAYQYFVSTGLENPGEFRSLWRLSNETFTHGFTSTRDDELPSLAKHLSGELIFDSTFQLPDGTYISKYDFADFVQNLDYYGIYGDGFGSWYIHAGKDYFNGDHLRQELAVHREVQTGDSTLLNMINGVHFFSRRNITVVAQKTFGPWLWYLNDGSASDAATKATEEKEAWPYAWMRDTRYQSRGSLTGRLVLSDGRPASNAAIFLGDNDADLSTLRQGRAYYYPFYADSDGKIDLSNIRAGTYSLTARSNGSSVSDVSSNITVNDIRIDAGETTELGTVTWDKSQRKQLFHVGDFDRTAAGFQVGGEPRAYGLAEKCPADLVFDVTSSATSDWCYAQTKVGNWTIQFPIGEAYSEEEEARLIISLAAYSEGAYYHTLVNGKQVGTVGPGTLANDGALYRGCTLVGEWRQLEFAFDSSLLVPESTNEVTLWLYENNWEDMESMTTSQRGPMYDAIALEW